MIVMIVNLSTPDSVNRAQSILAFLSWNFQVFEFSGQVPGDEGHQFDERWLSDCIYNVEIQFWFPSISIIAKNQKWQRQ